MRTLVLILTATTAVVFAACDAVDSAKCTDGADPWVEHRLFMGRSGPDGEIVDDAEWEAFLADTVTPRFPDGLTVIDGKGQWRGSDGVIQKESSKILIIFVPNGDEDAESLILQISNEYKRRFEQESVLKTVGETCLAF